MSEVSQLATKLVENTKHNRESWLTEVAARAEPVFRGLKLPAYRLTCGWPHKEGLAGPGRRRLGECHASVTSTAGLHEIFVSPLLDAPLEVAGVICHEMSHVAAGIDAGHGRRFVKVCKHVGLTRGKPTSAMPGERLAEFLTGVIAKVGPYPHRRMNPVARVKQAGKKDITLACPNCGCKVRMTIRWLAEAGSPKCGCGTLFGADD